MKVSVLGLGIIGRSWARHYCHDGVLAAVWNRTPKPDVEGWVPSAREAASAGDMIQIVVADPAAVESVVNSILPSLGKGKLVVQSSTIDPGSSRRFAEMVQSTGADYLEAPFTGSKPAAEARETVFYLGGADEVVQRAEPLLSRVSKKRFHIGTVEQACVLKLAMNLQIAAQAQALCESYRLAVQAGISDDVFFGCLRVNASYSGVTALKEPKLCAKDYSPQFSIKHMHKDLRLLADAAKSLPLPLSDEVRRLFESAEQAGFGDEDFIALYKCLDNE